jgi:hypothetical protein
MIRAGAHGWTPRPSDHLIGPISAPFQGMKMFLILVLSVAALFFWQRHGRNDAAQETKLPVSTSAVAATTPRPVSEHNWAKHSLDRANEVAGQVRKTRQQDEQP